MSSSGQRPDAIDDGVDTFETQLEVVRTDVDALQSSVAGADTAASKATALTDASDADS